MPSLNIVPDVDVDGFRVLRGKSGEEISRGLIHLADGAHIEIGGLSGGMESGKPSVAFCFLLPDGRPVVAETSLALFLTAADVLRARHGDPR
jgi:hypothetical protein